MSEFDILFPIPEGNRNADDMGMPQNKGPDFSDGHDCEGFPGGCARFGCPGAVSQHLCTELPNVQIEGQPASGLSHSNAGLG